MIAFALMLFLAGVGVASIGASLPVFVSFGALHALQPVWVLAGLGMAAVGIVIAFLIVTGALVLAAVAIPLGIVAVILLPVAACIAVGALPILLVVVPCALLLRLIISPRRRPVAR